MKCGALVYKKGVTFIPQSLTVRSSIAEPLVLNQRDPTNALREVAWLSTMKDEKVCDTCLLLSAHSLFKPFFL